MPKDPIEINPTSATQYAVIWLHGLGADGNDFVPIVRELAIPDAKGLRFVFPNAPMMPVTVNAGHIMPAWYDIAQPDLTNKVDAAGILRSVAYLETLIEAEKARGIPAQRIVLAGFSQGGVIALATALRANEKLAGVMALSTYLPLEVESPSHHELDIFQGHGQVDDVVPLAVALDTRHRLEQFGHQVSWHEYPMAHAVNQQEIADIRAWLMRLS